MLTKTSVQHDAITLVALSVRTNNADEMNPVTAKIGPIWGQYWQNNIADSILHRVAPGRTIAVYTDYASDEHGDYTYYLGEQVNSLEQSNPLLKSIIIPAGHFVKFTTPWGKMPDVVIAGWQAIWAMSPENLGARRAFQADFETYDDRAADPTRACMDIYIGLTR